SGNARTTEQAIWKACASPGTAKANHQPPVAAGSNRMTLRLRRVYVRVLTTSHRFLFFQVRIRLRRHRSRRRMYRDYGAGSPDAGAHGALPRAFRRRPVARATWDALLTVGWDPCRPRLVHSHDLRLKASQSPEEVGSHQSL